MRRTLCVGMMLLGALAGCAAGLREFDAAEIERQVLEADDARAACHERGDVAGAAAYLSERYVYNDIAANRITKAQMLARRSEDRRRVVEATVVDSELVVLSEDVVLQRGREDTVAQYYGGLPRRGGGRHLTVWQREPDGKWRIVAEQATEATPRAFPVKMRIAASDAELAPFAGVYLVATEPPLRFVVRVEKGALLATIPGQFEDMVFYPEGAAAYFAVERPFELVFDEAGDGLTLTCWGTPVRGRREKD